MIFAVKADDRFSGGRGEASWVSRAGKITGLDAADRQILSDWLVRARTFGIDTVIDLAVRPWRIAGPRAIIGVFKKEMDQASWLIVRYRTGWILIGCTDGFISEVPEALADILVLIEAFSAKGLRCRLV